MRSKSETIRKPKWENGKNTAGRVRFVIGAFDILIYFGFRISIFGFYL